MASNRYFGRIYKGIGGYYTVVDETTQKTYTLSAGGRLRLEDISPLPGDIVEFELLPQDDGEIEGAIIAIEERTSLMTRPRIANMDCIVAIVSAKKPNPDFILLDKILINASMVQIDAIAVLNKIDLATEEEKQNFSADYAAFSPLCVSAKTEEGMQAIHQLTKEKLCGFAGQSAVGKSSIINHFISHKQMEVGKVSKKTSRGKHTTRHAELLQVEGGGALVDTPGFSLLDLPTMPPEDLTLYYKEFTPYLTLCHFAGCTHQSEPGCAVKQAVEEGNIPKNRWLRYGTILEQVKSKWSTRYE